MNLTIYHYPRCSTCRKAIKWLEEKGHELNKIDISEQPPTAAMIKQWLEHNELKLQQFYNTSGQVYRSLNMKEKRNEMTEEEQLQLLASEGMLIKRPIVTDGTQATVGFSEQVYKQHWQ